MTHPLAVREARLDDLQVIVELRLALLREYGDHPLYANLRTDAAERARALYSAQIISPTETIFVAERERAIVGLLRCVDSPSSPLLLPERYCYVSSVYVLPAERQKGVLRALLSAADRWCAGRGIDEMRLHNASSSIVAQQAWSSLGFEVVEHVRRRSLSVGAH
ncbi:MAG: GCN5-related N-acetyltransferase [Gemmatimonadetes bacterium]|nr:GCN5-related N-acetyltransferase [Gemmatimonadota bacterium]